MRILYLTDPAMHGDDVKRVQRLLAGANKWKKNFHPGPIDGVYGAKTAGAVKEAKWYLGYPKTKCNRICGPRFVDYLTGARRLPSTYAVRKRLRAHSSIRDKIVTEAQWGINHEPSIHYAQIRPMPLTRWGNHNLPITTDCSGAVTCIYKKAGAPDPNGRRYDGQGYTGSMYDHMRHISRDQLKKGDLVIFGANPTKHVALVMSVGDDPLLFSHGQERGPIAIRLSTEKAYFAGQKVTYLSAGV